MLGSSNSTASPIADTLTTSQFIEVARKIISFDSTPQSSTTELCEYLKELSENLGLLAEIQYESIHGETQANIIVRSQPAQSGDVHLLLQSHLDTVDPGAFALWKKNDQNPFDAVIEEGAIYGIGAADVKLDFLCKLLTLAELKKEKFTHLVPLVVGTFGEETGMQGALRLFRKNKINARYALLGEPSNLKIISGAKGFVTVEVRIPFSKQELKLKEQFNQEVTVAAESKIFSGKAAHSSTPHLGENAANKLLDYVSSLDEDHLVIDIDAGSRFSTIPHQAFIEVTRLSETFDLTKKETSLANTVVSNQAESKNVNVTKSQGHNVIYKIKRIYEALKAVEKEMQKISDSEFMPEHSTVSIGVIRQYEDYILLGGSCRILPSVNQEVYEEWINQIKVACEKVGAEFHLQDYKRPFRTAVSSILLRAAQAELESMQLSPQCETISSANESSLFARMGIDCICFGAGVREGNIHTPQEHVRIKDLELSTVFYTNMIRRLCL